FPACRRGSGARRVQALEETDECRVFPLEVEVTHKALDQDEIPLVLADNLVRDVDTVVLHRLDRRPFSHARRHPSRVETRRYAGETPDMSCAVSRSDLRAILTEILCRHCAAHTEQIALAVGRRLGTTSLFAPKDLRQRVMRSLGARTRTRRPSTVRPVHVTSV